MFAKPTLKACLFNKFLPIDENFVLVTKLRCYITAVNILISHFSYRIKN